MERKTAPKAAATAAAPPKTEFIDLFQIIATQQHDESKKTEKKVVRPCNFVFVGPKKSGKSMLIDVARDKPPSDEVKPTTALDYCFLRTSTSVSEEKSLSNYWELGGGRSLVGLLDTAITPELLADTVLVIVLDLSKASRVMDDLLFWVQYFKRITDACLTKMKATQPQLSAQLSERAMRVFPEGHPDRTRVDPFKLPLLIVGNKWDLAKNLQPVQLNALSRSLRAVTHYFGASLVYTSKLSKPLLQQFFDSRIKRFVLNRPQAQMLQIDPAHPINVTPGSDSFEKIGLPPNSRAVDNIVQAWVDFCRTVLPPTEADKEDLSAATEPKLFEEPDVDRALRLKEAELMKLKQQAAFQRKMRQTDGV